jgi:hypothetical protein
MSNSCGVPAPASRMDMSSSGLPSALRPFGAISTVASTWLRFSGMKALPPKW